MIKKEAEKFIKYEDLTTDIQRTWNVKKKTIVIPVIIWATGIASKIIRKSPD